MSHSCNLVDKASIANSRLLLVAILLGTMLGFAALPAQEPAKQKSSGNADKTGQSDLPRLPRDQLLVYRGEDGKPAPVKASRTGPSVGPKWCAAWNS